MADPGGLGQPNGGESSDDAMAMALEGFDKKWASIKNSCSNASDEDLSEAAAARQPAAAARQPAAASSTAASGEREL